MSDYEHKKGDRVLADVVVTKAAKGDHCAVVADLHYENQSDPHRYAHCMNIEPACVHPHPGVSVAALLEEFELRDALWDGEYVGDRSECRKAEARVQELRAARDAANEPKKGQDVWVRGIWKGGDQPVFGKGVCIVHIGSCAHAFHPDDIRTEKP